MRLFQGSTPPRDLIGMLGPVDWAAIVAATAAAAALRALGATTTDTLFLMGLAAAAAAIAAFDLRYRIIPDAITLPLCGLGLGYCAAGQIDALPMRLVTLILGVAALLALRQLHFHLRRRQGLGLGDVKLIAAAAVWLDPVSLPTLVLAAALTGLAQALVARLRGGETTAPIAFGVHLAVWLWLLAAAAALAAP